MRTTGKAAGQVNPKPAPATSWAGSIRAVRAVYARSSGVPFRSPSSTTRSVFSAATARPNASAPASRCPEARPARGLTRTDPRWAAYTASGPRSVATVVRRPRLSTSFSSAGLAAPSGPASIATSTGRVSDSGNLLHTPTVPSTVWCGYTAASSLSYVPRACAASSSRASTSAPEPASARAVPVGSGFSAPTLWETTMRSPAGWVLSVSSPPKRFSHAAAGTSRASAAEAERRSSAPAASGRTGPNQGRKVSTRLPRFPIRFGTLACSSRNRPRSTAAAASSGPRRHTPGLRGASAAPRPSVAPGSSRVPPVPGVPGGRGRPAVPSPFTGSGWEAVVRPRSPPSAVAAEGSSGRCRGSGRVREAGVRADSGDRVMPPVKAGRGCPRVCPFRYADHRCRLLPSDACVC